MVRKEWLRDGMLNMERTSNIRKPNSGEKFLMAECTPFMFLCTDVTYILSNFISLENGVIAKMLAVFEWNATITLIIIFRSTFQCCLFYYGWQCRSPPIFHFFLSLAVLIHNDSNACISESRHLIEMRTGVWRPPMRTTSSVCVYGLLDSSTSVYSFIC